MEEGKVLSEKEHEVETRTLSSNLGTLRFELETMKRRVKEMDNTSSFQQKKIEGNII